MLKRVKNFAVYRPIRSLRDLPPSGREYLLKQMKNYLFNCELEEKRLRTFKERVNR